MISSNKNEDTPLTTPMNIQSEVTEGLTILRCSVLEPRQDLE